MAVNNSKEAIVVDNLEKIKEWLGNGITMTAIAKNLHISKQTLYNHLKKHLKDGLDEIKNNRQPAVANLENSMYEAALGGKVTLKKYVKLKHIEYENGKKLREWEEVEEVEVEEYIKQDTTAGIFLLKNWGNYMNEPATVQLRKEEVDLRKKQVEANTW